ncbi:YigZ family protein [Maribacter algarum]|uniref:YigZ family protein n=1 Tax=Maribacter algarum (ex Zhang et al. 2020) TaxID=2578118 RepID=A0A5S3PHF3_9FLAO|nr:YigZ family protein [Maribacter algarum]TMM53622.1 YigZ family protein [Maribacter algarum]
MDKLSDTYRTLSKPSGEILFKEKKSKFFGYAFPIQNEDEVKPIIESLRKKHHTAGHVCYAWQLGTEQIRYRANDDGEPNNSAGQPIYGQLQAFDVTNVLVAVARIFGGTKLGVGGLIAAYRTGAQLALENADIVEKKLERQFELSFGYDDMDKVMRIIKQKRFTISSQQLEMDCTLIVLARKSEAENFSSFFEGLHKVKIKKID